MPTIASIEDFRTHVEPHFETARAYLAGRAPGWTWRWARMRWEGGTRFWVVLAFQRTSDGLLVIDSESTTQNLTVSRLRQMAGAILTRLPS